MKANDEVYGVMGTIPRWDKLRSCPVPPTLWPARHKRGPDPWLWDGFSAWTHPGKSWKHVGGVGQLTSFYFDLHGLQSTDV